jgi:hypothetical protein
MNRKLINILLIILGMAIVILIAKDYIGNKAGKPKPNPYEYDLDEFRKVDSTAVLFHEIITFAVPSEELKAIAVDGKNLLVLATKMVYKFDYAGKELFRKELADSAHCIAISEKGGIWIGSRNYISLYNSTFDLIRKWEPFNNKAFITSLAISGEWIYVADAGNRIVYKCDENGKILAKIGEKDEQKGLPGYVIPSPYFDLALDDENFLWAVNPGRHIIENYNPDGSLRTNWGKTSIQIEGFSGCCNPAYFAIMNDNSFITSEKGMPRIKWHGQHGEFLGVVASPDQFNDDSFTAPDVVVDARQRVVALDFERKQVRIFEKNEQDNEQ